tara:strand:+ start:648 stop:833 length:186 start_codon:yes stop_codon:yes gene_type:complete
MTYKLIRNVDTGDIVDYVTRKSDGATIPFDPENADYQEYLTWLDAVDEDGNKLGNTAEPAD